MRIYCVYSQPVMTRTISWEVLNRELVWHEVSELLLLVLPLLGAQVGQRTPQPFWRRWLSRLLKTGDVAVRLEYGIECFGRGKASFPAFLPKMWLLRLPEILLSNVCPDASFFGMYFLEQAVYGF